MAAARIIVTGTVQGVFYRAWTEQNARALDITGWVRNCNDGSVEAHIEGNDANVDRMEMRMKSGPPAAKVESLTREDVPRGDFTDFTVRH